MFKMTREEPQEKNDTIPMGEMKPLQIAMVVEVGHEYFGEIVMRTSKSCTPEIMILSSPKTDSFWCEGCSLKVRLLPPGARVILEVTDQ